jgi:hypothetical protein
MPSATTNAVTLVIAGKAAGPIIRDKHQLVIGLGRLP